jgi:hypothetical protein
MPATGKLACRQIRYKKYATDTRKGGGKRNIQLASTPPLYYNHEG